jgi:hypothetical protein
VPNVVATTVHRRPGAWEQPAPKGYQARLDRFVTDDADADENAAQPATIAASEPATIEAET